jgi:hypothetical protein
MSQEGQWKRIGSGKAKKIFNTGDTEEHRVEQQPYVPRRLKPFSYGQLTAALEALRHPKAFSMTSVRIKSPGWGGFFMGI